MPRFQVLNNTADTDTIRQMCSEMDSAMITESADLGRYAEHDAPATRRYRITLQSNDYPTAHSWCQHTLHTLCPNEAVSVIAYVRQTQPTGLHTDHSLNMLTGHTLILPLRDSASGDSTIVFDVDSRGDGSSDSVAGRMQELAREWSARPRLHHDPLTVSALSHCDAYALHLPILGRFHYRVGDAVIFHGHLLHCSNNWSALRPHRQHRDYLLIHTRPQDSDCYVNELL